MNSLDVQQFDSIPCSVLSVDEGLLPFVDGGVHFLFPSFFIVNYLMFHDQESPPSYKGGGSIATTLSLCHLCVQAEGTFSYLYIKLQTLTVTCRHILTSYILQVNIIESLPSLCAG